MKKVVKSRADLNAKALHNGGTVTNKSGQRFNASGKKKQIIKKAAPKKKVEAPKPDTSALAVEAIERQTAELKLVLEGLKEQMAAIKLEHPEPITAWDIIPIRNKDLIIEKIELRVPDLYLPRTIN